MAVDYITLRFAGRTRLACVRELCGADEAAVPDSSTGSAIRILDRLLVDAGGCLQPGGADTLSGFDRDRLLAAVYRRAYADRIDGTVTCRRCEKRFDLHFSLGELQSALDRESAARGIDPDADGLLRTSDGLAFRLPTGRDECEAAALPPDAARGALADRLVDSSSRGATPEELDAALGQAAPLLDLEMDACCPECETHQPVRFNVQVYLLESILRERRRLVSDVHRLATVYGWSRREILELPRGDRRLHVELIEGEHARRRPHL